MAATASDKDVAIRRETRYAVTPRSLVSYGVGLTALAAVAAATSGIGPVAPHRTTTAGGDVRYEREVTLSSATRGCHWQSTNDPEVQIAECGDERDTTLLVFRNGRVTEYRVVVRGLPSTQATPAPGGNSVTSRRTPTGWRP